MKFDYVSIKDITNNHDRKRIPLNAKQREEKSKNPIYPYIGANNIMGYVDEYIFDEKILCVAEDGGSWGKMEKCAQIYDEKVWVNNHAHVLTAKPNLKLEYLKYYLNYADLNLHINGATRGKLTQSSLNMIKVPLPALDQQIRIAEILDTADAYRQKTQALLEKYDQLAQSIFLEMFGDPVSNPKGWKINNLNEVSNKITDGTHHSPPLSSTGYPYVTAKHIKNFRLDFLSNPTFVDEQRHKEIYKRCNPEKGDVLYIKDGATTGIACLNQFEQEISLLSSVALIKTNPNQLNGAFLCFWLNYEGVKNGLMRKYMSGAAIKRFTLKKIKSFELIIPPIQIQNQFAVNVVEIENQKKITTASLEKAEELFNSLLQKAFTGELTN